MDGRDRMASPAPLHRTAAAAALGAAAVGTACLPLFHTPVTALAAAGFFAAVALVALTAFARAHPDTPFGAANAITLGRAGLVAVFAGYAVDPPAGDDRSWWIAAALAAAALLLDGADGWAARRRGLATAFGARFDMEADALAGLVLCVVIWRADRTGAWIVLIGALRYIFLLAGRVFAAMRRPLPPSRRRRTVCALQGVLLVLCLPPVLPAWGAPLLGGAALALTGLSFLIDTAWLVRRRVAPA